MKMKKYWAYLLTLSAFAMPALAAGGLDEATNAIEDISDWLYKALGAGSSIVIAYYVLLVWMDKKQWVDVLGAITKVAIGGGILTLSAWAWSIWGG